MGTILKNGINYSGSGSGGGGGVSSYNELTDKPSIEGVALSGNKTASDLGLVKASDIPSTDSFYSTSDTTFTDLADADYMPMYDSSASTKKKTLWSNIKSVLKTYFDSLYQKTLTAGTNISFSGTGNTTINASMPVLGTINRSDIYDTTEKVVGKWKDGRPIYQKTFTGTLTNATEAGTEALTSVAMGVNVAEYISFVGTVSTTTGNYHIISTARISDANLQEMRIVGWNNSATSNKNTMIIHNAWYTTGTNTYTITVRYTKTTDAANSYNYANENDYSTSEKVIGTWVDGSTLYQKTINFGTLPNNTTKTVAHGISGTFTVVDTRAIAINGTTQTFASEFYDGSSYCFINRLGPNIQAKTNANFSSYSVYVTIKYVKKQL